MDQASKGLDTQNWGSGLCEGSVSWAVQPAVIGETLNGKVSRFVMAEFFRGHLF